MRSKTQSTEQRIYFRCLLALPFLILFAVLCHTGCLVPTQFLPPCMFHSLTGFSCPGCGCTRAITALLQGDIFLSLRNNPCILYCAGLYILFVISHSVSFVAQMIQRFNGNSCSAHDDLSFEAKKDPSPHQGKGSLFQLLSRIHGMKCTPMYLYILVYLFLGFGILRFLVELWQHLY